MILMATQEGGAWTVVDTAMICRGLLVEANEERLFVPAFAARGGELLCLHWPYLACSWAERKFYHMLTRTIPTEVLEVRGRVVEAPEAPRHQGEGSRGGALAFLAAHGLPEEMACRRLKELWLPPAVDICCLHELKRACLFLDVAFHQADVVVFRTCRYQSTGRGHVLYHAWASARRVGGIGLHMAYSAAGQPRCPAIARCIAIERWRGQLTRDRRYRPAIQGFSCS